MRSVFARRRDLFNDLDLVFLIPPPSTSTARGSRRRGAASPRITARMKQVMIGVVIDRHGRPLVGNLAGQCHQRPGAAAGRRPPAWALRHRPKLRRRRSRHVSARTLAEREERGIEYILGTRSGGCRVRETVVADTTDMVPLSIPKAARTTTTSRSRRSWSGPGIMQSRDDCLLQPEWSLETPSGDRDHRGAAGGLVAARRQIPGRQQRCPGVPEGGRRDHHFALDEAKVAEEAKLDGFYAAHGAPHPRGGHALPRTAEGRAKYSAPPRPCSKRGRSMAPATPPSAATRSPPSWPGAAQGIAAGCRRPNWISMKDVTPTSTASSRPRRTAGTSLRAAQPSARLLRTMSRPLASPCAPVPTPGRRKTRRAPRPAQPRKPASAASHPVSVCHAGREKRN